METLRFKIFQEAISRYINETVQQFPNRVAIFEFSRVIYCIVTINKTFKLHQQRLNSIVADATQSICELHSVQ